jgi:hypothetical protein
MPVSFANDIAPIFSPYRANMLWRFDLIDYDQVKANAAAIVKFIDPDDPDIGNSGRMPPANYGNALTRQQIEMFQQWMNEGYPP